MSVCLVISDTELYSVRQDVTSPPERFSPLCTRYVHWEPPSHLLLPSPDPRGPCHGAFKRNVCHLGVLDLPGVRAHRPQCLVVNKFDVGVDPMAPACWEEMVRYGDLF